MRLRAQRTQAHARRDKALADRGDRFHLLDRHRLAQWLDVQQVAQMDRRIRLHLLRILLPQLVRRLVTGHLQHMHRGRFPGMGLAAGARLVEAADRQHVQTGFPALVMHLLGLVLNAADADAADPAGHAGEVIGTHRPAQAHRLEVQTAAIGGNHRDPHLRHDLQQPLVDRLAITRHRLGQRPVQQPALDPVGQRILGQIGVHDGRAAGNQHREVMRIDTFRRPHQQRTEGAQPVAD